MIKLKIKRNQTLSDKLRKMYNLSDEMLLFPETECDYNKDPLGTQKNSQITQWGNGYYRDINNKMYPKEIIDNYFDIVNEC